METEALGPLSLPEAMALLGGERVDANELVFLALLELVARGAIEVVPLAGGEAHALRPVDPQRVTARPLASIIELIGETMKIDPRGATGVTTPKYMQRRFAERWGTAGGYARIEVWMTLKKRGFSGAVAGRPIATIWDLTENGTAERQRILAVGTRDDWRERPATTLLRAAGLPVPGGDMFDILDELEDEITPGAAYDPLQALNIGPSF